MEKSISNTSYSDNALAPEELANSKNEVIANAECICRGNWRQIIKEVEHLIDKQFAEERTGNIFTFVGVLHGSDDYYYAMSRSGEFKLLSCVGSINGFGFKLIAS